MPLTLQVAEAIIQVAQDQARDLGLTVSAAVVDPAGNLISFARMDDGPWVHAEIAIAKARVSASSNRSGTELLEMLPMNPHFAFQTQFLMRGRMFRERGCVPIRDTSEDVLGALGVSGGNSSEDDQKVADGVIAAIQKGAIRVA